MGLLRRFRFELRWTLLVSPNIWIFYLISNLCSVIYQTWGGGTLCTCFLVFSFMFNVVFLFCHWNNRSSLKIISHTYTNYHPHKTDFIISACIRHVFVSLLLWSRELQLLSVWEDTEFPLSFHKVPEFALRYVHPWLQCNPESASASVRTFTDTQLWPCLCSTTPDTARGGEWQWWLQSYGSSRLQFHVLCFLDSTTQVIVHQDPPSSPNDTLLISEKTHNSQVMI